MNKSFVDEAVEFLNKKIEDHCDKECHPVICMGDDCHYKQGMLFPLNKLNEQR